MRKSMSLVVATFVLRVTCMSVAVLPLVECHAGEESVAIVKSRTPTAESARSAFDFVNSIGANTHINYFDRTYGNFPLLQRELKSVGILHLRDGVHLLNPDYNKMVYGRWIELGKQGIRFDAVVDPRSKLPPLTSDLFNQVNDLAGHTIESFEGANELDIGKVDDWTSVDKDFQGRLFHAVNSMSTRNGIKVIGPSLAFARHGLNLGDLSAQMDEGNLHPYPAGKLPSTIYPEQTTLARMASASKPVVITETGYHNALNDHHDQPAVSEAAAGKYMPRLFLENFGRGIVRTYLYEFFDEAPDPDLKDNQLHWGIVRADGSEKPAFTALKNLISELGDTTEPSATTSFAWTLDAASSDIHHVLLQKSTGEIDLILWQEVPVFDTKQQTDIANPSVPSTITFGRSVQRVDAFEPSVQSGPVQSFKNASQIRIEIPDSPLVLRIQP